MKIRIKRKKQVISEAAKGPIDLPKSHYVKVSYDPGEAYVVEYKQLAPSDQKIEGIVSIEKSDLDWSDCVKNSYTVVKSEAEKGWGPMLYDIAMELIGSREGAMLVSDRDLVSTDAKNVWDFYNDNRTDTQIKQLDIDRDGLAGFYGKDDKKWPFKQLTPKDTSDDCSQNSSLYWAVGKGDWKIHKLKDQRKAVKTNPDKAKDWHKQSISKGYFQKDISTVDQLMKTKQIKFIRG